MQQKTLFERELISRADMNRARVQYLSALSALPGRMSEIYKNEMAVADLKRQITEGAYCTRARGFADATRL